MEQYCIGELVEVGRQKKHPIGFYVNNSADVMSTCNLNCCYSCVDLVVDVFLFSIHGQLPVHIKIHIFPWEAIS